MAFDLWGQQSAFARSLATKYSLLGQNADADTTRANAASTSANASANLDTVRAGILPSQSAAEIALQRAQTLLTGEQAKIVAPESVARINLSGSQENENIANTALIDQNTVGAKFNNQTYTIPSALRRVMGGSALPALGLGGGFQAGDPLPARRLGESQAAYLDRINPS